MALDLFGIDTNFDLPIDLDMQLTSDDGRVQVVSGGGNVAGLPTGPLAELLTNAIVVQLKRLPLARPLRFASGLGHAQPRRSGA